MIPNKNTLANTPYWCRGQRGKAQFGYKEKHIKISHDKSRCNITLTPNPGAPGKFLAGEKNVGGEAAYLPYDNNRIFSIRLEAPSPSGRGVKFFYTENLHGCKFYVDTIKNSKDVIVYHVNAITQDPGGLDRLPNYQEPLCISTLDEMHRKAQQSYGSIIQKNIIAFGKKDYFEAANQIYQQKKIRKLPYGVRKRQVCWGGKCFICAYPAYDKWKFYYQTYGEVSYDRPTGVGNVIVGALTFHWNYLNKLAREGKKGVIQDLEVIAHGEIPLI
ncbi:MAG: hypothetical protein GY806_00235 [Gammaproteobacteria bacterium]|nr:hypothetical protein [Gammaproteobacteria bacterium]